jgi:molecular chaperone GrpE
MQKQLDDLNAQVADLTGKLSEQEAQQAELKDQYLRKVAETDNFRKRMLKEKQDAIDFANQKVFEDLIPVIDNFERAIQSADVTVQAAESADASAPIDYEAQFKSLHDGVAMIEKTLVTMLEQKWGLKRFESAGQPFDPNKHEALMMEKSADVTEPTVAEDLMKGYTLKDRVIRPAKVKVTMPEDK